MVMKKSDRIAAHKISRGRARPRSSSIFGCKHDRKNPDGLLRIGGVFAAIGQCAVVVVDFPKEALAFVLERGKVPVAVRVLSSVKLSNISTFSRSSVSTPNELSSQRNLARTISV
jgi:hypothetical protein